MRPSKRVLDFYVAHSISIGLGVAVVGVLLLVWAGFEEGTASVILATVGGAVLTIGMLSVINDAFLKDIFVRDIFAALELQTSVRDAGLRWIKRSSTVTPADWLDEATSVRVLPLNAVDFRRTDLRPIAEAAAGRPVSLAVFVPDPQPPHLEALAFSLGEDSVRLATDLKAVDGDLVRAWATVPPSAGSSLHVYRYEGQPSCGLTATDTLLLVEVMPAIRYPLTGRDSWTLAFALDSGPARLLLSAIDPGQASRINEWPKPPSREAAPPPASAAGTDTDPPSILAERGGGSVRSQGVTTPGDSDAISTPTPTPEEERF